MRIEYYHNLGKIAAVKRIDNLFKELQEKYRDKISSPIKYWNKTKDRMDFRFNIKGYNISGNVYVRDNSIILEEKLPFAARLFSGKIENIIREQLEKILS